MKKIHYLNHKSIGIGKAMWDYHFNMGYTHGRVGIYNSEKTISVEQRQAYKAGHLKGIKELDLIYLLQGK